MCSWGSENCGYQRYFHLILPQEKKEGYPPCSWKLPRGTAAFFQSLHSYAPFSVGPRGKRGKGSYRFCGSIYGSQKSYKIF